jgi:hypothetical protein
MLNIFIVKESPNLSHQLSRIFSLEEGSDLAVTIEIFNSGYFPVLQQHNCRYSHAVSHAQVFLFFFYLVGWDLTPIRSLCRSPRFVLSPSTAATHWPIVHFSPDDTWGWLWSNWWSERRLQGKPKCSEKTFPAPLCPTTNPTCLGPVSNPGPQRWEASD